MGEGARLGDRGRFRRELGREGFGVGERAREGTEPELGRKLGRTDRAGEEAGTGGARLQSAAGRMRTRRPVDCLGGLEKLERRRSAKDAKERRKLDGRTTAWWRRAAVPGRLRVGPGGGWAEKSSPWSP